MTRLYPTIHGFSTLEGSSARPDRANLAFRRLITIIYRILTLSRCTKFEDVRDIEWAQTVHYFQRVSSIPAGNFLYPPKFWRTNLPIGTRYRVANDLGRRTPSVH
jgi:hypothetical protein